MEELSLKILLEKIKNLTVDLNDVIINQTGDFDTINNSIINLQQNIDNLNTTKTNTSDLNDYIPNTGNTNTNTLTIGRNNINLNTTGKLYYNNKEIATLYSAGTGLSLNNNTFNINLNYTTNNKNYAVKESGGSLYVNVPWINTEYNNATTTQAGLMSSTDKSNLDNMKTKLDNISSGATKVAFNSETSSGTKIATITINDKENILYVPTATAYQAGTGLDLTNNIFSIKLNYNTNNKNYAVKEDNGNLYVNVPWTDNNTTYTANTGIKLNGTTFQHTNSVASKTNKSQTNRTLSWGENFVIYEELYDTQGHITSVQSTTITMPGNPNINYYHTTGTWDGLKYTANKVGSPADLSFTIPTGTTATTVALGNHTHSYAGSNSVGGAANSVVNSIVIKLNNGTTEDTNLFTFDGSKSKIINITPASIGASATSHTHNYAGSTSIGGSANSAVKLDSINIGTTNKPVYFDNNGKPVAIGYTIQSNVPSDAKFTDTVTTVSYTSSISGTKIGTLTINGATTDLYAPTPEQAVTYTAGSGLNLTSNSFSVNTSYTTTNKNYKVAVDSTSGGLFVNVPWENTTYNNASTSNAGLMSSTDKSNLDTMKTKLDGIQSGATKVEFTAKYTTGTEIGTITINDNQTVIYIPSTGGSVDSANKLNCGNVGDRNRPVYFNNGEPYAISNLILHSGIIPAPSSTGNIVCGYIRNLLEHCIYNTIATSVFVFANWLSSVNELVIGYKPTRNEDDSVYKIFNYNVTNSKLTLQSEDIFNINGKNIEIKNSANNAFIKLKSEFENDENSDTLIHINANGSDISLNGYLIKIQGNSSHISVDDSIRLNSNNEININASEINTNANTINLKKENAALNIEVGQFEMSATMDFNFECGGSPSWHVQNFYINTKNDCKAYYNNKEIATVDDINTLTNKITQLENKLEFILNDSITFTLNSSSWQYNSSGSYYYQDVYTSTIGTLPDYTKGTVGPATVTNYNTLEMIAKAKIIASKNGSDAITFRAYGTKPTSNITVALNIEYDECNNGALFSVFPHL